MTGLEKILGEIERESEEKVSLIISQAKERAEEIIAAAREEAKTEAEHIEERAENRAMDILSRAKSAGELYAKKAILLKKREIVEDVISKAKEKLISLPDGEYFEVMGKMLEKFAHKEEGEILLSQKDIKRMPADFSEILKAKGLTVSDKTLNEVGGFVLIYGDIEEKCTFDAVFESEKDRFTDIVLKTVFE